MPRERKNKTQHRNKKTWIRIMKATSEQKPFVLAVGDAGNLSSTVINQAYICHVSSQIGIILKKISILTCPGDSCKKTSLHLLFPCKNKYR